MNILINCSNLKKGGGQQVGDSICGMLDKFDQHKFIVVLSSYMDNTAQKIARYDNVKVVRHDIRNDWKSLLLGRDTVLDGLVKEHGVEAVLTVFGPSRWRPRCKHLCGFARPHLVLGDSPYYKQMSWKQITKEKSLNKVLGYFFQRDADMFWTENPYITEKLKKLFHKKRVETVTNYYNQVFDTPEQWKRKDIGEFEGVTILSVNAPYPHKNMEIALDAAKILRTEHPDFKFRFVMTIPMEAYPQIPPELAPHFNLIGKVDISEVPSLYEQADICFQPSLLECFSATYPEAMRMEVPIVTTDVEFAKGLCGAAAEYYSAVDPASAADAIYRVATDKALRTKLIENGKSQLRTFDNYEARATKLINLLETI